jgi:hypothetical protein
MAYRHIPAPREKIAEAKRLYEGGLAPARDIAALLGFSPTTLRRRAKEWRWERRKTGGTEAAPVARDEAGLVTQQADPRAGAVPSSPQERLTLTERIHAAAEREITAVEQILEALGDTDKSETENAARTLASVARTLRELVQLDASPERADPTHEQPVPRDLGELRRSLAQKLEALIAGDADSLPEYP